MNFTRWSARLTGTQRRAAAARAATKAQHTAEGAAFDPAADTADDCAAERDDKPGAGRGRTPHPTRSGEGNERAKSPYRNTAKNSGKYIGKCICKNTGEGDGKTGENDAGKSDGTDPLPESETGPHPMTETNRNTTGTPPLSLPDEPVQPDLTPALRRAWAPVATRPHGEDRALVTRSIDALTVHDLLGQVPTLAAVVHGPDHRIAYVNDAWTERFGPRGAGAPAREALPELTELGLIPLMDQVFRSGRPRTLKSRRVPAPATPGLRELGSGPSTVPAVPSSAPERTDRTARDSYYTFTCTPITAAGERGVLIFAGDVTDQVEAAERLRASESRQREAAVALQRSLLPQELEQPDALRVAATYQPGGTDAAVGGDWYDVITLGAGRTALVIGDVMGRGVRAAAVMGQLRTAVRAYAQLDLPPHEVLQNLDALAAQIDPSQIATCVYAVHDPAEDRLDYASAGHLPVIVRERDGTLHRAAEPTGPPLGTGGWLHSSASLPLTPGSSAVLYTDGLVERRDADIDAGIDALENAFAGADGPADIVCDRLLRALGVTAEHDDDVAVLVVQHPERTGPEAERFHNAALELLGGTETAPRARAFASGVLSSWRFPRELHDLGVLAAGELVANSLQHGTPPMCLRLRRTDRRLTIEVTDGNEQLPRRRRADPVDEAGRGITVVASIASAWGSRRTPGGGKSVWCEFALPAGA